MKATRLVQARWSFGRDFWLVAGLLAGGVALPLAVSALAGTLEIPRNDDWSYRHIAVGLARTGQFALDGISETMIIGQILFTQPFLWVSGLQPWAFTAAGVAFAVGGALSSFALARRVLPARDAAFAAALLVIIPGYLAYATSFMSDVPALAAQFFCLALGAMAVGRRPVQIRWLLASTAMGIFAFSIREFALAAPASVLLAAIAVEPRRRRTWALALGTAGCFVAIHLWRASLPGQLPPVGPGYGSFAASTLAFSSVAFVVAPAALVGAIKWREHLRRFDLFVGLEVGAILVVARLLQWAREGSMPPITLNNVASQWGVPARDYLVGGRPLLFTDALWMAVNSLALVASVIVLTVGAGIMGAHLRRCDRSWRAFVARIGSPAGILVLFVAAVAFGLVAFGLSRPIFDRYFWPLVPPLAVLFLYLPRDDETLAPIRSDHRGNLVLAGTATVVTAVLATMSGVYLLNSHAFDAARWSAGNRLVQEGFSADTIDAGYEWVGYHATTPGDPTNRTSTVTFYRSWWTSFAPCAIVSSAPIPLPGRELLGTTNYALNLVAGPVETLYLYRITSSDCP